jgi:subtilisin family serine protease
MAAPLTAGVAALVRAADPSLKPAAVVDRIHMNAANIGGPVSQRIDASTALMSKSASVRTVVYLAMIMQ